jgi:hypothetical protein
MLAHRNVNDAMIGPALDASIAGKSTAVIWPALVV